MIRPVWPAPDRVRAVVTTRIGGVSQGRYADMNLGMHTGDAPEAVAENRRRLAAMISARPVWMRQVHGTGVLQADDWRCNSEPEADAAVARTPGTACVVMVADCLPILVASESASAVGAIHVGWRGLAAGVIETTLAKLEPCETLHAWLGPAIGPRAYEVGEEVRTAFVQRDPQLEAAFRAVRPGYWMLDLYAAARRRLLACGVRLDRIHGGGFCTFSEPQRFYSYRREPVTGRIAALIWLE